MQRVILLGASNLTLSFPLLFESLRSRLERPLEIVAAHGHGRSYGMQSRILTRALPGMHDCQLWDDLAQRPAPDAGTLALITDVGNDILYGADVDEIVDWVERCLIKLNEQQAKTVLTLLPLASAERLSAWRYKLTRTCFFPSSRMSWSDTLGRAKRLNDSLQQLGEKYSATLFEPRKEWYGIDPIHVRRRHRPVAWQQILASWFADEQPLPMQSSSIPSALRLWRLRSATRHIFGQSSSAIQPSLQLDDDTSVWLY